MTSGPQFPREQMTAEEEHAMELAVRHRNRVTAALLAVFVALVIIATVLMMLRSGFQPLDNIDLFRS